MQITKFKGFFRPNKVRTSTRFLGLFKTTNKIQDRFKIARTMVNRGEWLSSQANIEGANKDAKIYVGKSTNTMHELCNQGICTG